MLIAPARNSERDGGCDENHRPAIETAGGSPGSIHDPVRCPVTGPGGPQRRSPRSDTGRVEATSPGPVGRRFRAAHAGKVDSTAQEFEGASGRGTEGELG